MKNRYIAWRIVFQQGRFVSAVMALLETLKYGPVSDEELAAFLKAHRGF